MKISEEIRATVEYKNALLLIESECESTADFARKIGRSSSQAAAYIGPNPTKRIGGITRKLIEKSFDLPSGWLSCELDEDAIIPKEKKIMTPPVLKDETLLKIEHIKVLRNELWDEVYISKIKDEQYWVENEKQYVQFTQNLSNALDVMPFNYRTIVAKGLEKMAVNYVAHKMSEKSDLKRLYCESTDPLEFEGIKEKDKLTISIICGVFDLVMAPYKGSELTVINVKRLNLSSDTLMLGSHASEFLKELKSVTQGLDRKVKAYDILILELNDGRLMLPTETLEEGTRIIESIKNKWGEIVNFSVEEMQNHLTLTDNNQRLIDV